MELTIMIIILPCFATLLGHKKQASFLSNITASA